MNWMLEHAREASRFNATLGAARRRNLDGTYDAHTNMMHYPAIMQPTHARWEAVPPPTETPETNGTNGTSKPITSADNDGDIDMAEENTEEPTKTESIFTPVNPVYTRNYLIVDTLYETPPNGLTSGIPGPDGNSYDMGFNGLSSIPEDIRNLLPDDCKQAFEAALRDELEWKNKFGTESRDGARASTIINKGFMGPP